MLFKLKSLKSSSVLNATPIVQESASRTEKSFKYLKNTPEVKRTLDFIKRMDEEISEAINQYKAEREERLVIELELCKNISEKKIGEERDTKSFLQMCNFDESSCTFSEEQVGDPKFIQEIELRSNKLKAKQNKATEFSFLRNFVKRNIYVAKQGAMATFSLTDEEKTKIAELLKDIDNFQIDDGELILSPHSLTESSYDSTENTEGSHKSEISDCNAFSISGQDRIRLGEIDNHLEKFIVDQEANDIAKKSVPVVKDTEFWKKYVLDQSLKNIDSELEKLYLSYIDDEEKLKKNSDTENVKVKNE